MSEISDVRRQRILHAIRGAEDPVGVAELAARLRLHPNTARFHLDALERAGDIQRVSVTAQDLDARRGRPPVRYRASARTDDAHRRYELLAEILTSGLSRSENGRELAAEAGYAWGHARACATSSPIEGPREALIALLTDAGFAPRSADAGTLEFYNCPFREAASRYGEIVCAVHAGLMRGMLAASHPTSGAGSGSAPAEELSALEPFVAPGVCRARLAFAS